MTVTVKFEVLDLHPGRGHVRQCVHEETRKYEVHEGNFAILPGAGKHYVELMRRFNGPAGKCMLGKCRYEVRYYTI